MLIPGLPEGILVYMNKYKNLWNNSSIFNIRRFQHTNILWILKGLFIIQISAFAQNNPSEIPSNAEIKARQLNVESEYKKELEDCYQKFAVNQCKDSASEKRLSELSKLREYELRNNEIERARRQDELIKDAKLKADQRDLDLEKQKEQANSSDAERQRLNIEKNEQHDSKLSQNPKKNGLETSKSEVRAPLSAPDRDARAKFEAKQREAAQHKADVEKRLLEKEIKSRPTTAPVAKDQITTTPGAAKNPTSSQGGQ